MAVKLVGSDRTCGKVNQNRCCFFYRSFGNKYCWCTMTFTDILLSGQNFGPPLIVLKTNLFKVLTKLTFGKVSNASYTNIVLI